ncbi:MAG: nucleoside recognition domain-containing protein [Legionellaceae bacterium]|nr:nucleoside recognition domain-containing protein [Legionellaceae bacterium]
MLNTIWLGLMLLAIVTGCIQGTLDQVVIAVTESAKQAAAISLGLAGIMAFWLGIMQIAYKSQLLEKVARVLAPILRRLFPEVPPEDPAMQAIVMNLSANMLGIGNAATPFGLEAMKGLSRLHPNSNEASNAMCTFLAINTSSVQLIPTTAIALLAAHGATHPTHIIITSLIATSCSTVVAIVAVKWLATWPRFRLQPEVST